MRRKDPAGGTILPMLIVIPVLVFAQCSEDEPQQPKQQEKQHER